MRAGLKAVRVVEASMVSERKEGKKYRDMYPGFRIFKLDLNVSHGLCNARYQSSFKRKKAKYNRQCCCEEEKKYILR